MKPPLLLVVFIVSVTLSIPINCLPLCKSERNFTICLSDGCLEGKEIQEGSYEAFLGIPFAEPPVGHLRFSNPVPAKRWSGLLNATTEKSDCIQKNVLLPNPTVMGSEDCLYLNVYRPIVPKNVSGNKLLPVMVFIHGGAFFAGSASPSILGPQYFMENGEIILVAMSYRLGALGFLSTEDEHSPGNFGFKDQTVALRWVRSNIRYIWSVDPLTLYRLVVEHNSTEAFLTQDPTVIWESGQFKHIPWMTGTVEHEGAVRAAAIVTNQVLLDDLNTQLPYLLPVLMEIDSESKLESDVIYEKLKNYYLNGRDTVNKSNMQGFIDMFSDRAFIYPYYKSVQSYVRYANTNQSPVSLYRFIFKGPISYSLAYTGTTEDLGVVHLDDTLYLFGSPFPPFPPNTVYSNLTKTLVDFYVSFARNGRPTRLSKDNVDECTKLHKGPFCDYQEFDNTADGSGFEVRTNNDFDCAMVNFWDDILQ